MLACYCLQGKQLASGMIDRSTNQSHYNVSGINRTPCARLLLRHPLAQCIPTEACECSVRLPFGIVSSQDEFQRRVEETYEGVVRWCRYNCRAFTRFRRNALVREGSRLYIHFEWGDVILCRTELWLRWVPVRCVSCFACSKSLRMFNFSRGNACVSQSNCLSCITDSTGASQSDPVYAHVQKAASSKKKMVVFVPKSCLFDFFLLRFFLRYRRIDTGQFKNPFIVTEKYV